MTEVEKLIQNNLGLVHAILRDKFSWIQFDEDYIQVGRIGLWKAAKAYDTTKKIPFASFAYVCICNEIKMELRRQTKQKPQFCVSLEEELLKDGELTIADTLEDKSLSDFTVIIEHKEALSSFKGRDAQLIAYLIEGLTQKEMAERLGISQTYVSRILSKLQTKVRAVYEN